MKTVILVWKLGYYNYTTTDTDYFWGIGDMLRGAYGMFNLSKRMNFKLVVDYSLHPISNFLKNNNDEISALVKDKQNEIPLVYPIEKVIDHITNKFKESDMVLLYSNLAPDAYDTPPTEELKEFMKSLLIPNQSFQSYIDTKLATIPYPEFSILHYRIGDDELVRNNINNINTFIKHLLTNKYPNDILITDSTTFKQNIVNNKLNIFLFNESICHIGVNSNLEAIQHTLFELLLISKAKSIRSFNKYGWISGFVHAISIIYNIPITSQNNM
jgi:hypothetical protein